MLACSFDKNKAKRISGYNKVKKFIQGHVRVFSTSTW